MIRILLSTRLGERRMTQTELARATGIRAQTINELYHDFAERISLDDLDLRQSRKSELFKSLWLPIIVSLVTTLTVNALQWLWPLLSRWFSNSLV